MNWWFSASGRKSPTRSAGKSCWTPDVPTILRDLPYSDQRTTVPVRGQDEAVKPTQIIIWASITDLSQRVFDLSTPRFPVVLDTGLSHNFSIQEELLHRW